MAGNLSVGQRYDLLCKGIDLDKEEALGDSIEACLVVWDDNIKGLPSKVTVNCEYLRKGGLCEAMASQYGSQPGWEFKLPHCVYSCSSPKRANEIATSLKGAGN